MVDWTRVIRAIRLTNMSVEQMLDRMEEMGRPIYGDYIYKMHAGRYRNPHYDVGDTLLRILEERDPQAYERLYVQTRVDHRRRAA